MAFRCAAFNSRTRWAKAQCRIGNFAHALLFSDDEAHIGCHAGHERQIRVRCRHDHGVGNHVRDYLRRLAHLLDFALKRAARKGIHRKCGAQAGAHTTNLGFVNRGVYLHVAQALRNHKQFRRREAGCHSLPRLNAALDDDAINRRLDLRALQIDTCLCQRRFALRDDGERVF